MSSTEPEFSPEDYEGLQPKQVSLHPAELRKLRKEAKHAEELQAQLAELQRREMFRDAGIPINDQTKYFVNGYNGELTPEAIKAEAVRAGFIESAAPTSEEIAGHTAAANAAAGAEPPAVKPDYAARLAELARKQFAPADDAARSAHIAEIARLAKEAGARIQVT